jgi:hypothetical protein
VWVGGWVGGWGVGGGGGGGGGWGVVVGVGGVGGGARWRGMHSMTASCKLSTTKNTAICLTYNGVQEKLAKAVHILPQQSCQGDVNGQSLTQQRAEMCWCGCTCGSCTLEHRRSRVHSHKLT